MADHVHMMISIPPKYAVAQVVGYIKGKSAIHVARHFGERRRSFVGHHFWARGYFVSTVGRDEDVIRRYIRNQENEDRQQVQPGKRCKRREVTSGSIIDRSGEDRAQDSGGQDCEHQRSIDRREIANRSAMAPILFLNYRWLPSPTTRSLATYCFLRSQY